MTGADIRSIIASAAAGGVYLRASGENLTLVGPGQPSPRLLDELKASKPVLLEFLRQTGPFPCFPLRLGQQALWELCRMPAVSALYNVFVAFTLSPGVEHGKLQHAVRIALSQHPLLASSFVMADGKPHHLLAPTEQIARAASVDVLELDGAPVEPSIRELAARELDLWRGPLVRFVLLRNGREPAHLVVVSHHLVADFATLRALTASLMAAYRDVDTERPGRGYGDYVLARQRVHTARVTRGADEFWAPRIERMHRGFPSLSNGRMDLGLRREQFERTLPHDRQSVRESLQKRTTYGATEYALYLCAFQRAIAEVLGTRECLIGTPVNLRTTEWSAVAGNFIDFVPLELTIDPAEPFEASVERAHAESCRVLGHASTFWEALESQSELARGFRCQAAFVWVPEFLDASLAPPFDGVLGCSGQVGAFEQLTCVMTPGKSGVRVRLIADTAAFDSEVCRRLLDEVQCSVERIVPRAATPVARGAEAAASSPGSAGVVVGVAATFAVEPALPAFVALEQRFGLKISLDVAPPNTVVQSLIGAAGPFTGGGQRVSVVLWRADDWFSSSSAGHDAEQSVDELIDALKQWRSSCSSHLLFGIASPREGRAPALQQLVQRLREFVVRLPRAELLDLDPLEAGAGSSAVLGRTAGIPYGPDAYSILATRLYRRISVHFRMPFKAIVVDCDDTLWAGICGEDGPLGVVVTPALQAFQRKLVELTAAGFILCLVSRNNEDDVLCVFGSRPEMPLQLEHVSTFRINWEPKSANIESIARELNIGTSSMIFIDDDRVNLEEVRGRLPEVLALQMPKEERDVLAFVENNWAFDVVENAAAVDRTRFYQANRQRREVEVAAVSLQDYIGKLAIETVVRPLIDEWERTAELFQRTNQFVFNKKRYDVPGLQAFVAGQARSIWVVSVKDKFGDYGVVGAMCLEHSSDALVVDSFALSCRALGRGVEHHVMRHLAQMAADAGCSELRIAFEATSRNEPARRFLRLLADLDEHSRELRVSCGAAAAVNVGASGAVRLEVEPESMKEPKRAAPQRTRQELDALRQVAERRHVVPALSEPTARPSWPRARTSGRPEEILAQHLGQAPDWSKSFFENGGTSLQALAFLAQLHRELGVELGFQELYGATSLSGFIERLSDPLQPLSGSGMQALKRATPSFTAPIGPAQRRVLFLQLMNPTSTLFNNPAVLEFSRGFDLQRFERAVDELIGRWEPLRTRFERAEAGFIQRVEGTSTVTVRVHDVGPDWSLDRSRYVQPFDVLGADPLVRIEVMRRSADAAAVFVDVHHAVADGRSFGILLDELLDSYFDARQRPDAAPERALVAIQFADYAAWQEEVGFSRETVEFWQRLVSSRPPRLTLPWTVAAPDQSVFRMATHVSRLTPERMARIRGLAQREGVSLASALLAFFAILIERLSSQCEIVVGVPVSGRVQPQVEGIVGMFVNTLPLLLDVPRSRDGAHLLREVAARLQAALLHQAYPLDRIVRDSNLEREPNKNPLMDVLFSFGELGSSHPQSSKEGVELRRLTAEEDIYYLSFDVYADLATGGGELQMSYATEVFTPESIATWATMYEQIAVAVCADPSRAVEQIEVVSAAERALLLGPSKPWAWLAPFEGLAQRVRSYALERPNAAAVAQGGQSWSYAALVEDATKYASALRERGIGKGACVVVSVEKGYSLAAVLFGVLACGAAYVNVERNTPEQRLLHIVEETQAKLIIADERPSLVALRGPRATPGELAAEAAVLAPAEFAAVQPDDLMYVVYTSGSTGTPKGVAITHGNAIAMATGESKDYGIEAASPRVLQLASVAFDVFTGDLLRCFLNGGCLIFPENRELVDPEEVRGLIESAMVTMLETTPALALRLFGVRAAWRPRWPALKLVIVGSDVFTWSDYALIRQGLPEHARILNSYGVSEAAIDSTWCSPDAVHPAPTHGVVSIGRALTNVATYVVNSGLQLQPFGVPGELVIGGPTVSPGYLGGGNMARFVTSPFGSERWYRTGDRVRLAHDGTLSFEGRLDRQLKLRGFRIEPAEIEHHLLEVPTIRRARVDAVRISQQDVLVAWYEAEQELPQAQLGDALRRALPSYMLPERLVWLPRFPLTENGKVDAKALLECLPAPMAQQPPSREDAEDALVMAVRRVWVRVLAHENFATDQSFFAAGGDSIGLLDLQAGLRSELGEAVAITDLFRWPSVRETAQFLRERRRAFVPAHSRPRAPSSVRQLVEALINGSIGVAAAQQALRDIE